MSSEPQVIIGTIVDAASVQNVEFVQGATVEAIELLGAQYVAYMLATRIGALFTLQAWPRPSELFSPELDVNLPLADRSALRAVADVANAVIQQGKPKEVMDRVVDPEILQRMVLHAAGTLLTLYGAFDS